MDLPPSTVGKNTYLHRYGGWRRALKAFVERANSQVAEESAENLNRGASAATATMPTEPSVTNTTGAGQQPVNVLQTRSRPKARSPANVIPEDRRDPTIGLRFKVLQRDRFKCVLCGDCPARNEECVLHVDHVIPWSKGGKTREDNLRTLCATCNIGRGNRV
jgi:5-methylcytosine-specific restriction endonuclease McrA